MNGPSAEALAHAGEVLRRCLDEGRGVPAVMARAPFLRGAAAAVRAEVARLAVRALGARRRLEVGLGDALRGRPAARAQALVVAAAVEADEAVGAAARGLPTRAQLAARVQAIADPDERFAVTASVPGWLGARLRAAFGDDAAAVLAALGAPAPRTVRANLLRVPSRDALIARLADEGLAAAPATLAETAAHVRGDDDLFRTRAFRDGCFEQQDEASQLAVAAVAPPPRGRVLDLCCGSGGKTLALAAALQNRGAVLAVDVHDRRVAELQRRLPRAGADNVRPLCLADRAADDEVAAFARRADRVLIDAPCSGTGSWRRRPEARWSLDEAGLAAMVATQRELLARAAGWLRPGARLVYATCSLLPDENERQVAWLRERDPGLELVRLAEVVGGARAARIGDATGTYLSLRPDLHGCDGFFAAILRRRRAD